jgi:hypothetical protein
MAFLSATVCTEVVGNRQEVFAYTVPIDLTSIFTGYGPLPAVTGTERQTGRWNGENQTRTVVLSDGSSAREMLTRYDYPNYFSYKVSEFTGFLGIFAASATGEWWFDGASSGRTTIKWRYTFHTRHFWSGPVLCSITHLAWRGYMRKALALLRRQLVRMYP